MNAWAGAASSLLVRTLRLAGWGRSARLTEQLDHGHLPFGAWEAELTAYAQLRAGAPLRVRFGHTGELTWGEEVHLHRPPSGALPGAALQAAELELEHALMHYRHGWRETALLWHCWAYPTDELLLPWPPWDQVGLPPTLIRTALGRAVPELALDESAVLTRDRLRHACRWLAAAWADGAHRTLEVAERPGMAERLPLPMPAAPRSSTTWHGVLLSLAGATDAPRGLSPAGMEAQERVRSTGVDEVGRHVASVLELAQVLAKENALPAVPDQHVAWLRPMWGRWHHERLLQRQLDDIARSPETAQIASITARGRAVASLTGGRSGRLGIGAGGGGRRGDGPRPKDRDPTKRAEMTEEPLPAGWGVTPPPTAPEQGELSQSAAAGAASEGSGQGQTSSGVLGAEPGTLGALHVVRPSGADRAAYWQLRGALAPHIERLVERLMTTGNLLDHATPRRLQRSGRIDRGRLHAALSGRETVFTRFIRTPDPEHALCLLLDCSASMTVHAELLREMAILCEAAAAAVGARVTAFSFGPSWERMEPPAFRAPLVALGRELHPHGGTPFGPALQTAAAWLAQQPYVQKRLWVFTDGRWSARDRIVSGWRPEQLTNTVVWVLSDERPEPPHAAMRVESATSLPELVDAAPRLFWLPPGGGSGQDFPLGGAG